MKQLLAALAFTAAITGPALADAPASASKMATDDCARARAQHKTCELTIDSDEVTGDRPSVGETNITIAPWTKGTSLIQVRRDFIPEILKSAEDL